MSEVPHNSEASPYVELERAAWAQLAGTAETVLTPEEVVNLRGLGDQLDLREIEQVYLPSFRQNPLSPNYGSHQTSKSSHPLRSRRIPPEKRTRAEKFSMTERL